MLAVTVASRQKGRGRRLVITALGRDIGNTYYLKKPAALNTTTWIACREQIRGRTLTLVVMAKYLDSGLVFPPNFVVGVCDRRLPSRGAARDGGRTESM